MNSILTQLHNNHQIWRGNNHHNVLDMLGSSNDALDDYLNGGFPDNSVIELQTINGIGELRLIMPLLNHKTQAGRLLVFITPPSAISSQMLQANDISPQQVVLLTTQVEANALWSAEQCLKSGCVGAVVLWHQQFSTAQIKRLKLAASQGQANLIIIRHKPTLSPLLPQSLPVQLSLAISPNILGLSIAINKQLGHWPKAPYVLDMRQRWPDLVEQQKPHNVVELHQRRVG